MKEFKDFNIACKYRETLAKRRGSGYNVTIEEIEEGVWLVKEEPREGIMEVMEDTGKNFVKGISGGMSLRDMRKTETSESFGDVFRDAGKNFVKGLSGGLGLGNKKSGGGDEKN